MNQLAIIDAYGVLTEPTTLKIQRLLPGPIERIWGYLTDSAMRRKWLAAGEMELKVGAPFEFVWRNSELTDPPGKRPDGFGEEHRMQSRITELDPPHRLAFAWEGSGDVSIDLEEKGEKVLLTVIHRQLPNRKTMLAVGAGWHMHLDLLVVRASGEEPQPFWDGWSRLKEEYDRRLPA
jgi:uncharacterized protein YndB with AHSA1/START domain